MFSCGCTGLPETNGRIVRLQRQGYVLRDGRWISKDPIGFAAGDSNLYRYVGNSPTNAADPSGLVKVNYISGRGQFTNFSNAAPPMGITPGYAETEFLATWTPNRDMFVDDDGCKLCDKVGFVQVATGEFSYNGGIFTGIAGGLDGVRNEGPFVDADYPEIAYPHSDPNTSYPAAGDPTSGPISMSDLPSIPQNNTPLLYLNHGIKKFETVVVCLSGKEGPKTETMAMRGGHFTELDSITVYGTITWSFSTTRQSPNVFSVSRPAPRVGGAPSQTWVNAVASRFRIVDTAQ